MVESSNCLAGGFVGKERLLLSTHINGLRIILAGRMPARIKFTDEEIKKGTRKYEKGVPITELAEEFEVSVTPVRRMLQENGYDTGPIKADLAEKQVNKVPELYQQGLSATDIGNRLGVSIGTVLRVLRKKGYKIDAPGAKRGTKPPNYIKRDIPKPWSDKDTAYMFGVLIGDGSLICGKNNPEGISLGTPDEEFSGAFIGAVESAFEIQVNRYPEYETPAFRAYSVDLGRSYDRFKWRKETWRVPEPFFDAPEEIKIALCQGKLDSDGHPIENGGAILVVSINKAGLKELLEVVKSLNFETTFRGPYPPRSLNEKEKWKLRILNASSELFRLPRKKKVLQRANS